MLYLSGQIYKKLLPSGAEHSARKHNPMNSSEMRSVHHERHSALVDTTLQVRACMRSNSTRTASAEMDEHGSTMKAYLRV